MRYFLLTLFVALSCTSFAQCANPVSAGDFQAAFNQLAVQQVPEAKLSKSIEFVNNNCLLSAQVKTLAQLFANDKDRFAFCKAAFPRTQDQVNFYEVYDAFTGLTDALRLHDFVHGNALGAPQVTPVVAPVPSTPAQKPLTFPKWAYPSSAGYTGTKGCPGPAATNDELLAVAGTLDGQPTDEARQVAIQNAANEECFDLAQAMKLVSTIKSESVRMNTLVNIFPSLFDLEHYASVAAVFPTTPMKTQWNNFASTQLAPPAPPCEVSEADHKAAINALKSKSFSDDRLKLIDILAKDKCFSTEQIRAISQLAPFGEEKIAMFKKLYPKCTDKPNYYKLVDELKFSHEQQELNDFISKN